MASEAAEAVFERSRGSFDFVRKRDVGDLQSCAEPPRYILQAGQAVCSVLGLKKGCWEDIRSELRGEDFFGKVATFEPPKDDGDRERLVELLQPFLERADFSPKCMAFFSQPCVALCNWCRALFVYCGGSVELGTATPAEEVLSAAREAAAGAKEAAAVAEAAAAAAVKSLREKRAAELQSQRGGARRPVAVVPAKAEAKRAAAPPTKKLAGSKLVVRSMVSGEVVATLKGLTGESTSKEICKKLSRQLPQQRGCTYQLYFGEDALDNYKTLSELAIDTRPDGEGEVQFVAASFIDGDDVLTEAQATARLEAALQNLDNLRLADLAELRAFRKPPFLAELVVQAVCLLFEHEESWINGGKPLLYDRGLLLKMRDYDYHVIPDEMLVSLKWYVDHPDFKPEKVARVSRACEGLCRWCIGVYEVAKTVVQQNVAAG